LVLHHIAAESFDAAVLELKKCGVSSHYIIDVDGKILQLVEECDVAYHAGVSYWRGQNGLNKTSIGIEFYNPKPFEQKFSEAQIKAGIALCQDIIKRHNIAPENVVGHNEIAYFPDNEENRSKGIVGCLGRKQDPSSLFPWGEFVNHGVGENRVRIVEAKKVFNI
jgi:N-acetylmuramoyl-L-alanine amidase